MTVLTRTPNNTNLLQPTKFLLTFSRIPEVTYFCQEVNIPGMNLPNIIVPSPMLDYHAAGNKLTYNQLHVRFMVDEKLQSWQEIHTWFRSIASPESYVERKTLSQLQNQFNTKKSTSYSDATLTVLSSLNNPILRVKFINMFPITLSDVIFDSAQSADDIITADATFIFDYFNFEEV